MRINNFAGAVGDPWTAIDNIQIVPEPTTIALGGMGLAALLILRRRRKVYNHSKAEHC